MSAGACCGCVAAAGVPPFRAPPPPSTTARASCAAGAGRTSFGYDALGRAKAVTNALGAITRYRYDAAGNVTNAVDALNRTTKSNFLGGARLTVGSNKLSIVARDGASRDTEQTRAVFAPPTNPQAFRYDLNGNLVSDGFREYTWDEENRLTRVAATAAVPTAVRKRCDHVYDAQSRRVRTVLRNWSGSAWVVASTNTFVYDAWNPIAEISRPTGGAAVTNHYVWGLDLSGSLQGAGGIGGLLARYTQSGASATGTLLYTYDGNGNVTEVANVTGATVAQYRYDPFGVVVSATGTSAADNKVRWSSKLADDASGLVYYGYRWYAPEQRRWAASDPILDEGFTGGLGKRSLLLPSSGLATRYAHGVPARSRYAYLANAPGNGVEYLGLMATCIGIGCQQLNEQWMDAGVNCCPACEYEALAKMTKFQEYVMALYANHMAAEIAELKRRSTNAAGGVCTPTTPGAPGRWTAGDEIDNIASCGGYCMWIHEDFHRRECESRPWDNTWYMITIEDEALHDVPAYAASVSCLRNKVRFAEASARRYGGDMRLACECCKMARGKGTIPSFSSTLGELLWPF